MTRKFMLSMEDTNEEAVDTSSLDTEAVMVDPDAPVVENTTTDPVEGADESEDLPLPVIGELNVDKVYKEENDPVNEDQIVTEMVDENSDRVEAMDEAVESTDELIAVTQALKEDPSSYALVKVAMLALESHKRRLQFKNSVSSKVSLESFKDNTNLTAKVAMEGIMDVVKQIWEKICKVIKSSIEWLKKFFKEMLPGIRSDIKTLKEVTQAIVAQRNKDIRDKTLKLDPSKLNHLELQRYIAPGFTNAGLGRMLTINGKQPDNYLEEMQNVTYLLNYEEIGKVFNKNFIEQIKDVVKVELIEDDVSKLAIDFKPQELIAKGVNGQLAQNPSQTFGDKVAKEGQLFYILSPRLGGYTLAHEFKSYYANTGYGASSNTGVLEDIANWEITVITAGAEKPHDGWFRYLTTSEIETTSEQAVLTLDNLLEIERKYQDFIDFKAQMSNIALEASKHPFDLNSDKGEVKLNMSRLTVSAMAKINNVVDTITVTNAKYAKGTCKAWALYLNEIYKKEKQMLSA